MKLTLHMVSSLDGYIARKDNDVSWMDASWDSFAKGEEMTTDILSSIDCYIMGSHTYELALKLGWPYGDTKVIVVTHGEGLSPRTSVDFYSGDLPLLVKTLGDKNIWLVGGATLCREFLQLNLVDEICLTIVPILLGDGISFFGGSEQKLRLKEVTAFKNGMIDVWYHVLHAESSDS